MNKVTTTIKHLATMTRKPDGHGRVALQKKLRGDRANFITKLLLDRLDVDQIRRSMVIFPKNVSLRKRKWRRALRCLAYVTGRVYTKKLCMSVVKKILRSLPFEINLQPGQTLRDFVEAQGERMRRCAKSVRKMGDLDETQPLDDGEKARLNLLVLVSCSTFHSYTEFPSPSIDPMCCRRMEASRPRRAPDQRSWNNFS